MKEKELAAALAGKLRRHFGRELEDATAEQIYMACAFFARDILMEKWVATHERMEKMRPKQVYYLSMEFLVGRSLKNHLFNLGLLDTFDRCIENQFGVKFSEILDVERDAGLGNGGLGRLAACYQDALATGEYPAWGFSILYEYGIFKQRIVDGMQVELPDPWLETGSAWLVPKLDEVREVHFGGWIEERFENGRLSFVHHDYDTVLAVPHDMLISGYQSEDVSTLRLWRAKSKTTLDMNLFSQGEYVRAAEQEAMCEAISKVLYPEDAHPEGKSLRLKQQYFFTSATIQFILAEHKKLHGTVSNLADFAVIHINDTHPTVAIPELMRILIDEEGLPWDEAWNIVCRTVAYTNHTVMAEALERWTASLFQRLLPRLYQIVQEIDRRFRAELAARIPYDDARVARMAILANGEVRMANLCVATAFSTNGVSALHTDILKETVFHDFYDLYPERFHNVTNGIAHRRWIAQANPQLHALVCELIGDRYLKRPEQLENLLRFTKQKQVTDALAKIKAQNKEAFLRAYDIRPIEGAIFDVQAKRLHEYKRQLLNILRIVRDYHRILDNPNGDWQPKIYFFAAKAAPGYVMAKRIISLIHSLRSEIEADRVASRFIQVVFLEDYSVTLAERLIPASEVSEQISIAGKEASGTGNMKFMLNGALTLGTLDGANVEICEAVGRENIYIFGMTSDQVEQKRKGYAPHRYYEEDPALRRVLDHLRDGIGTGALRASYADIVNTLLMQDTYMLLADFADYCRVSDQLSEDYHDVCSWNQKSLVNIAKAGRFAADRSIHEYATNIWGIAPLLP